MAQLDTHQPSKTFRGTVDEVFSHRGEIPPGATVELKVFAPETADGYEGKSLADALHEIGTIKGLPGDLSTNPIHMQGFGTIKPRTP